MEIAGVSLHDWWNKAPYGAFGKAVREKLDPDWGRPVTISDLREYEVRVDYSYSGRGTHNITVKARDEKEAKKLALEEFDKNDGGLDFWDARVDDAEARTVTKL